MTRQDLIDRLTRQLGLITGPFASKTSPEAKAQIAISELRLILSEIKRGPLAEDGCTPTTAVLEREFERRGPLAAAMRRKAT